MSTEPTPNQDRSFAERMKRLARLRLIIPIMRSKHPPEYTARGVAMGIAWGFTPLVGAQMPVVAVLWAICRPFPKLSFAALPAMAWVWISNVFTMFPMYYMFYVTGQILRGRWHDVAGYEGFVGRWQEIVGNGDGFWQTVLQYLHIVAMEQGISLFVGCLPYMALTGWLGYVWSLKFVTHRRKKIRWRDVRIREKTDGDTESSLE